ncbi:MULTISPECIES: hypothetical protein [unclassified Janthinobacterium]|uniref:hypothetical protein n=1 Tax=unclassified Janthinobacterium TaxID=2610881 RepID=UPI0016144EE6|nr:MULTISPECIES: hypothetical protein [unclassified Janthinobacterium]MBB5606027.1 hypothetical protein [Janthinobacterium sp. S3T4]MBB5611055.1 hypothetical protein [Janthinobacterium sp. S3M3]
MLRRMLALFAVPVLMLLAQHASAVWQYVHKDFSGRYAIYGGYLEEAVSPAAGDAKAAFNLTGAAARDMFNAIGPDLKDACPDPQIRIRNRETLSCRYHPADGYRCDFGFDLSTGLSIAGSASAAICTSSPASKDGKK